MSGTSLDGIDAAIVDIRGRRIQTLAFESRPYPHGVREAILNVSTPAEIARLDMLLGELYAEAVKRIGSRKTIELIGCHGQTIYHQGKPAKYLGRRIACTWQIGNASVIAERTGIPVVSDFRSRDMAAGGQGAPLVPFVDYLLFRDARRNRIALNIGGIANITAIPAGAGPNDVIAFDTGPGNMMIDALATEYTRGRQRFDRGGAIAASGRVNRLLLSKLLADPYYAAPPPKSAGREQYGHRLKRAGLSLPDLIATVTELTAETIALGIRQTLRADEIIVSGGGAHNRHLMARLKVLMPDAALLTSDDFGVKVDAKEAVAFAVLAHETWRGRPSNLPSATGARHPVILGKITR